MREGIYRFEFSANPPSGIGVAKVVNDKITGIDDSFFYVGEREVCRYGKNGWRFKATLHSRPVGPHGCFEAVLYGEEGEKGFRLSGTLDADINVELAIDGRWIADL
jgi:hypothetical protein